jgi:hypothetical protein
MKRDQLMEKVHQGNMSNAGLRSPGFSLQRLNIYFSLKCASNIDMSQDFVCIEVI